MTNAGIIQKQQAAAAVKAKAPTIQDMIRKMGGEIEKALPSVITPERFTRITLSALSTNPQLQQCTPKSFLGAMMTSAQLGMEVNTPLGQAYLIPRRNNKTGEWECQFQLGYKGLIDMAHRSSEIRDIQAHVVCKGDVFEYELGLEPKLVHKPASTCTSRPITASQSLRTSWSFFMPDRLPSRQSRARQDTRCHSRAPRHGRTAGATGP